MPTYPPCEASTATPSPNATASLIRTPLPTPSYSSGGKFTILTRVLIPAPPADVLACVRDTTKWGEWNTFCPNCTPIPTSELVASDPSIPFGNPAWLTEGMEFTFDVYMDGSGLAPKKAPRVQRAVVTTLEPLPLDGDKRGYIIAWKANEWTDWTLRTERVMEFVEYKMEDGTIGTAYENWETFGGMLARFVRSNYGEQLVDRFGDYSRDLQGEVMKRMGEEPVGSVPEPAEPVEQTETVKVEAVKMKNAVLEDTSCNVCKD